MMSANNTNKRKRQQPRPVHSISAKSLGNPSFLRSRHHEQLHDSKRNRSIDGIKARKQARETFLADVSNHMRNYNTQHPITRDMDALGEAMGLRMAEMQQQQEMMMHNSEDDETTTAAMDLLPSIMSDSNQDITGGTFGRLRDLPECSQRDTQSSGGLWVAPTQVPEGPWVQSCQELDELRGRVVATTPEFDMGFSGGGTDSRGPDPRDVIVDDESPPFHNVVCRIQNWVVCLECVLDRYSVRRSLAQARVDMLERRRLRRMVDIPLETAQDYDLVYLNALSDRCGGDACLKDWQETIFESPRPLVPIWDRSVPRATDLQDRIHNHQEAMTQGDMHWCDCPDLVRRPALDLHSLVYALQPEGGRYDINNFAALIMSTSNPSAACLVYSSAKAQAGSTASSRVVCTGAKNPEEVAWSLHKLTSSILRAGSLPLRVERRGFRVSNVVASVLLPYYVDMDKLERQCRMYCTYTPEAFPGATLRLPGLGRVAILVFPTKLIIAGSKTKGVLDRTLRRAVHVTWRARYTDLSSQGARAMLKGHEKVLIELLDDASYGDKASPWETAIATASGTRR